MPDILTSKPLQIECQFCSFRGNAEEGAWHRKTTGHLIRVSPSESPQGAPKVSRAASEGENQSSVDSGAVTATPETIRISLPALRAVLMATFDDGDPTRRIAGLSRCEPWELDHAFPDVANDCRMRFADELERRLRQLPARG